MRGARALWIAFLDVQKYPYIVLLGASPCPFSIGLTCVSSMHFFPLFSLFSLKITIWLSLLMILQFQFSKLGLAQRTVLQSSWPQVHNSLVHLGQPNQTRSESPPQLGIMQIPCISPHHNVLLWTPKSHHGAMHLLVLP